MTPLPAQDRWLQLWAALATAMILALLGRLLWGTPSAPPRAVAEDALRLVFLPRQPAQRVPDPPRVSTRAPAVDARMPAGARPPRGAAAPPSSPSQTPSAPAAAATGMAATLYTGDGHPRLPDGVAVDPFAQAQGTPPGTLNPRDVAKSRRLLERPNPIDYRSTRFDKDWASDGTLGDVAVQGIDRAIKQLLPKNTHQSAVARPPPDVRFNPALHERPSDLGSEATGDAYKAAPIAFEKVPGLDGEASRRIRQALADLQQRRGACPAAQRARLLAPVQQHLDALLQVETAMAKGADPIRAQQLLPREADSAYDLARRALWYADQKLAACAP
ncbi:hypothetical protein NB699_002099 [Xanthomonas sacchari]|uniref:Uncharacterized protein n=4 Tax=Xanthomonas TaxID=338 RepID=A0AA46STZ2_9XANT|nr:hypothetical protein [Xanthomonas sacchari]MCW0367116.1 hypothetical protein [Xanthomonas sacchari]MCW0440972.1 hypothetical protein [Xanthomonas sacchari]UYK88501.1 hypothetical protein NG824_18825 [Xanthomonas sacchari]